VRGSAGHPLDYFVEVGAGFRYHSRTVADFDAGPVESVGLRRHEKIRDGVVTISGDEVALDYRGGQLTLTAAQALALGDALTRAATTQGTTTT
jgi:hypothetical protein